MKGNCKNFTLCSPCFFNFTTFILCLACKIIRNSTQDNEHNKLQAF